MEKLTWGRKKFELVGSKWTAKQEPNDKSLNVQVILKNQQMSPKN